MINSTFEQESFTRAEEEEGQVDSVRSNSGEKSPIKIRTTEVDDDRVPCGNCGRKFF